jgi:aspartate kinase
VSPYYEVRLKGVFQMQIDNDKTVFKFGGTSMGSAERIEHVAAICARARPSAVVVSAMAGETNRLVTLAKSISDRTDVPEYDLLVASGEQVSVALLCLALRKQGLKPHPMLASQAGIRTNAKHSKALIQSVEQDWILQKVAEGYLPVVAGFQGVTEEGMFTSLGRGGSDTSAVAIAAAIGAKTCVIYTDVDGVYTTDPRVCSNAKIIRRICYEEMLEMASQGSKVLHIRSVQLAAKFGIDLWVKNTFSEDKGTQMIEGGSKMESEVVTGVACSKEECWIALGPFADPIHDTLANVFGTLADHAINVDIITQNIEPSGKTVNFTLALVDKDKAIDVLRSTFVSAKLSVVENVAKVSIVGVGMRTHAGVAAKLFRTLQTAGVPVLLVTTSEIKVACLVERALADTAVKALHDAFIY